MVALTFHYPCSGASGRGSVMDLRTFLWLLAALLSVFVFSQPHLAYCQERSNCPARDGYTVQTETDHIGDDLYSGPCCPAVSNPDVVCNSRIDCVGYVFVTSRSKLPHLASMGYIKSSVGNPTPSVGLCVYTKIDINVACPTRLSAGYTVQRNVEQVGYDLVADPMSNLEGICSSQNECAGYVLFTAASRQPSLANMGYVKRSIGNPSTAPGLCLYSKIRSAICPAREGYTVQNDKDHAGDDLLSGPIDDPGGVCYNRNDCAGYVLFTETSRDPGVATKGYLKGTVVAAYSLLGVCLYTKIRTADCPERDGYTVQKDRTHDGDDLLPAVPVDNPNSVCNAQADCAGYVLYTSTSPYPAYANKGQLKRALVGTQSLLGVCLYIQIKSADCPAHDGYTVQVDKDHTRDNLLPSYVDNPAMVCNNRSDCAGYVLFTSTSENPELATMGYIKSSVLGTITSLGICLYTKISASTQDKSQGGNTKTTTIVVVVLVVSAAAVLLVVLVVVYYLRRQKTMREVMLYTNAASAASFKPSQFMPSNTYGEDFDELPRSTVASAARVQTLDDGIPVSQRFRSSFMRFMSKTMSLKHPQQQNNEPELYQRTTMALNKWPHAPVSRNQSEALSQLMALHSLASSKQQHQPKKSEHPPRQQLALKYGQPSISSQNGRRQLTVVNSQLHLDLASLLEAHQAMFPLSMKRTDY